MALESRVARLLVKSVMIYPERQNVASARVVAKFGKLPHFVDVGDAENRRRGQARRRGGIICLPFYVNFSIYDKFVTIRCV